MRDEFERMNFEEKVSYLMERENRIELPDDLAKEGVAVLAQAGEIEYAAAMARDRGMIDEAISILVDAAKAPSPAVKLVADALCLSVQQCLMAVRAVRAGP